MCCLIFLKFASHSSENKILSSLAAVVCLSPFFQVYFPPDNSGSTNSKSSMKSEKSVIPLLILLQFFFSDGYLIVLKSPHRIQGPAINPWQHQFPTKSIPFLLYHLEHRHL
uniref:Putative ovule protein n=1 Tax=Solanum chacoense TaxID=4108 RepID=A0A0V0H0R3_SOLCH